jgi:aldose 1-epimerase
MSSSHSVELHRLTHTGAAGTSTAVVAPAWGANIVGFAFHRQDLLWPISFLETVDAASLAAKPTSYGAPILAPTPGRLGTTPGAFVFDGREYRMAQARHGFLRNLPWTVVERSPASITCAVEVEPRESLGSFPFSFRAEHRVTVADGFLHAELSFRSTGAGDQPISAGWHPYLHRDPGCRLLIPAASRWELDTSEEPLPTGRLSPVGGASDFRGGRVLDSAEHWDVTLSDLAMADGVATSSLDSELSVLNAGGQRVEIAVRRVVRSPLANVQLYTAPGRAAIAVEPFSSPPNAVNLLAAGHTHAGVHRLRPDHAVRFAMALGLLVADR